MAHVTVTIAGRPYRMACGDGEEAHLQALGGEVDAKIAELRRSFGEIGDQRITVMAALTFADELSMANVRIAALEQEWDGLQQAHQASEAKSGDWSETVARSLLQAAARIEHVAQGLGATAAAREAEPTFAVKGREDSS